MPASFLLILLACALYGGLHSLLAAPAVKAWAARSLGWWGGRGYRLGFNLWALVSLAPLALLGARLPDAPLYRLGFPWLLLPLALQASGALLALVGVLQTGALGFMGVDALRPERAPRPATLQTGGLYRWVRHPLYTGTLLVLWAQPQMSANSLALALGLTVYLGVGVYFEERKLLREFGAAYADYRRRTPALFPHFFGQKRNQPPD